MKKHLKAILLALTFIASFSQSINWKGDLNNFQILHPSLILNDIGAGLSVVNFDYQLDDTLQFTGDIALNFNPSSSNKVVLDLIHQSNYRLYIEIGENGSKDAFKLIEVTNNKSSEVYSAQEGSAANGGLFRFKLITENNFGKLYLSNDYSSSFQLAGIFNLKAPMSGTASFKANCYYTKSNSKNIILSNFFVGDPSNYSNPVDTTKPYALLINEIMSKPKPGYLAFNEVEYIELYNPTTANIITNGFRLIINQNVINLPPILIESKQYLVISPEVLQSNSTFKNLNIDMPSLPDNNGKVVIRNSKEQIIHELEYALNNENYKYSGGWSWELQNIDFACLSSSYNYSNSNFGGTPGKENSISKDNNIKENFISSIYPRNDTTLVLNFKFPIQNLPSITNFKIESLSVDSIYFGNRLSQIIISSSSKIESKKSYTLDYNGDIETCSIISSLNQFVEFGWWNQPQNQSVIINEILFDPIGDESDYIEIINTSNSNFYNLFELALGNYSNNILSKLTPIISDTFLIKPKEIIVFSNDCQKTIEQYNYGELNQCISISNLPNFTNEEGVASIHSKNGFTIDSVNYNESWHHPVLSNTEGISLERISCEESSSDSSNWISCASTYNFGTPGAKNSSSFISVSKQENISISALFTPDNDGINDLLEIQYNDIQNNTIGSIYIYNSNGDLLKSVKESIPLNAKGSIYWNGVTNKGTLIKPGIYIAFVQLKNIENGNVKSHKLSFTVNNTIY